MKSIRLDYGRDGLHVQVPERDLIKVLRISPVEPLTNPERSVEESLLYPIGCVPLGDMARNKRSACIAICDITRPVPNQIVLPPILGTIEKAGIAREDILILIATGLHRPNEGSELLAMVGPEIVRDYRVENHVARDFASHVYLGLTKGETPAYVDKRFVEAELHIVTGFIEPHLMAGFSGGRKLICPGLASVQTVKAFHGPTLMDHVNAREGCLEGNPVHAESLAVARMARVDFAVSVALDETRNMVGVFSGELEESHLTGVDFVRKTVTDETPRPADIVITTAAGHPLDATFYQAVKGATAALPVVRDGGTIILVAECLEGLGGEEFRQLLREYPDLDAFEKRLWDDEFFVIDQWQYQKLSQAARKAEVVLVSHGLPADMKTCVPIPVFATVEAALKDALKKHGPDAGIVVIPSGPNVLARCRGDNIPNEGNRDELA